MNVTTDTRSTRIAVFIDFDNVEIGVKNTIGGQFDIGLVLEAIKERGEIVTKIAYSDWKRVGDYSRLLTEHAIRMVQRNMTPGGDKNGADITMALDALEMAFTHDHINAFVIVGGDSDFISLVEKLKQYGRKVIVVGGRQFTSATMQQNCHEFIAYENLVGSRGRVAGRGARPSAGTSPVTKALPLIMRALKVLSDREVTPQLGLLKSTLLQLDSTFSEREYGAGSFRDFMEKVAAAGAVTLREAGRSMLVEAREDGRGTMPTPGPPTRTSPPHRASVRDGDPGPARWGGTVAPAAPADLDTASSISVDSDSDEDALPASPMTMQDGIRAVLKAFAGSATPPRWPMYVRQAKQFLRNAIDGFDEKHYGFASVVDLLRAAGKEGVLRVERDRQGAVRVFAGPKLTAASMAALVEEGIVDAEVEDVAQAGSVAAEPVVEPPIVDAETVDDVGAMAAAGAEGAKQGVRRRRSAKAKTGGDATKTAKPRTPRARKTARTKAEAADSD
ncbi:MAG: NYN domain-containing protein [Acidobacteria bacterium]|nr:NYN domain-containing protein [Acidobacteriota bacterium]